MIVASILDRKPITLEDHVLELAMGPFNVAGFSQPRSMAIESINHMSNWELVQLISTAMQTMKS